MNSRSPLPRITVLFGPTGVGKTAAAIEAAAALNAEIINADSMQIYRFMDIGTAKPTPLEQARIPHHMIDVADPDEPFDAQRYSEMGRRIIFDLAAEGIPVLVAGGTGFYIRALIHGLFGSGTGNSLIRRRLKQEADGQGTAGLYRRLCTCDPGAAQKIHPNDSFRIIRALEIFETTGRPISACQEEHRRMPSLFDVLKIGLFRERELLYERINRRVDMMVEEGLVDEVRSLLDRGYSSRLKPLQSIGYRHMADFLEGRRGWDNTLQTLKQDTRHYAKRQMTWFKAEPHVKWIDADHPEEITHAISSFLFS